MKSKIDSYYIQHSTERIWQGDIIRDFKYPESTIVEKSRIITKTRIIPYLIIMSQDCDLEADYQNHEKENEKHDKYLHSILTCPAYVAEKLREGIHLEGLGFIMERFNSDRWQPIIKNQNPRYHFLIKSKLKDFQIPELVIDFKHYYTIPRDLLYKNSHNYIGTINELFREALSQRFTYYLSRIGLPPLEKDNKTENHPL